MQKNVWIFFGFAVVIGACGGGRTTAATQPTPAAFDPAKSDEKAIAAVDGMLTALGGIEAWNDVKQISWEQKYIRDGNMTAWFKHSWDRWNGRHRFDEANMESYTESMGKEGNPSKTKWLTAMYDLFDHEGKGSAMFGTNQLLKKDRDTVVANAHKAWQADSYRLAGHYKLKDPGAQLALDTEVSNVQDKYCSPSCDVIKVTFDPAVGEDTYYVSINSQSKMPEIYEKVMKEGRIGFAVLDWVDVDGMKFATKFQNLGLEGEVFQIENIRVGEPDDALYIPQVR